MRRVAFLIRFALVVAASSGIETALGDPYMSTKARHGQRKTGLTTTRATKAPA